MAVFKDYCVDEPTHYMVYCELTGVPVMKENAHTLYDFIALVRRLPKPFHFILDAQKASLDNFLPFIPQILIESKKGGVSRCLSTEIIVPDYGFVVKFFEPIFKSVAHLTKVKLTLLPCA